MPEYAGKPLARFEDPFNVVSRAFSQLYSFWVSATYPFASIGSDLFIHPTTMLNRRLAPGIKIGNSVIFRNYAWVNTFDLSGVKGDVKIIIEDHCVINAQCVISAKNKIHLEPHVMVSACALIMDHNHAYEDIGVPIQKQGLTPGGTIRIEEGCWIGHGAAIVKTFGAGNGDLGLHVVVILPGIDGVRFQDINHIERRAILVPFVELVERGNLPAEGWSGVASEDEHHGLRAAERSELDLRLSVAGWQGEVRRRIANLQPSGAGNEP